MVRPRSHLKEPNLAEVFISILNRSIEELLERQVRLFNSYLSEEEGIEACCWIVPKGIAGNSISVCAWLKPGQEISLNSWLPYSRYHLSLGHVIVDVPYCWKGLRYPLPPILDVGLDLFRSRVPILPPWKLRPSSVCQTLKGGQRI
jgi:hypothetical protein